MIKFLMKCGHVLYKNNNDYYVCNHCHCTQIIKDVVNDTELLKNRKAICDKHKYSKKYSY